MEYSGLRLLVDVGVGKKVERWLQEHGCDVKSIRNINPWMSDKEILKIAVSEKRLVITMDKDFGELIYNSGLPHRGVLLLRLEDAASDKKVEIVSKIMEKYSDRLMDVFAVFKNGKLRIRR